MHENNLKSAFAGTQDYKVEINSDGNISILDRSGKPVDLKTTDPMPAFKRIKNVRTLTIIEAEGSSCIYIPGYGWYCW